MVRAFFTVALAAASLSVLATRAPLDFGRIRFRVVTSPIPAKDNSVSVSLPDLSALAGTPAAIVIRLRGATEPTELALTLDGASIGAVSLAAGQETRVDASTSSLAGPGHHLVVNGNRPQWQLSYLEIANVHGFSRGIIGFEIVPRERRQFPTLPWWLLVPIGLGLLALRPRPDWPARVAHQRLYQAGVAIVLLLFVVVLTADRFTAFKILLSLKTAILCLAVLYAEWVRKAWTWVTRLATAIDARLDQWLATTSSVVRAAARPWMPPVLAAAVALSVVVLALTRGAHLRWRRRFLRLHRPVGVAGPRTAVRRPATRGRPAAGRRRLGHDAARVQTPDAVGSAGAHRPHLFTGSSDSDGRAPLAVWTERRLPRGTGAGRVDGLVDVRARARFRWPLARDSLPRYGSPPAQRL